MLKILFLLCTAILLTGCLPSLNPLSTTSETHLTDMQGMWKNGDKLYAVTPGKDYDTVVSGDITYKVIPAIVKGKLFVSICIQDTKFKDDGLFPFVMGVWSIYRLDIQGDKAVLSWIRNIDGTVQKCSAPESPMKILKSQDHMPLMISETPVIRKWMEKNTELYNADEASRNSITFLRTTLREEEKAPLQSKD